MRVGLQSWEDEGNIHQVCDRDWAVSDRRYVSQILAALWHQSIFFDTDGASMLSSLWICR